MPLDVTEAEVRRLLGTTADMPQKRTRIPRKERPPFQEQGYPLVGSVPLTLPWPPLNNKYWRHLPSGRTVLSAAARQYRLQVMRLTQVQWPVGLKKPFNNNLVAIIRAQPAHYVPYDIDSFQKAVLDALQYAQVYLNDNQIMVMLAVKCQPTPPEGHLHVTLHGYCPAAIDTIHKEIEEWVKERF